MPDDWKARLLAAIEADGRSDRAISLAAGLGENFINQLRHSDKDPAIGLIVRLAEELRIGPGALFQGGDITPEPKRMADWKTRLLAAVEADGRSHRALSLAAGLGPNFVSELHNTDKDPRITNVISLAGELGISPVALFLGHDITPEDEEILALLHSASTEYKAALMMILRGRRE